MTTEAEITEPSHLDLSPLCSVHIDCKQLEMFYFNQLESTSQIKTLDWDQGDIPQDTASPFELFSLASSKELDIPWQFPIQLN